MAIRCKKGSIPVDIILVMVIFITILSMFVVVGHTITTEIRDAMDDSGADLNTTAMNQTLDAFELFNTGVPFIFISSIIIALLLAWYVRSNPMVSFFMIMVICAVGYVAQGMSNAFYEMASSSALSDSANELDYIVTIENNLGFFILILGLVIVVFMFAKPKVDI